MQFINKEILEKLTALPRDRREKVIDGLVKMLAERPKGFLEELQNTIFSAADEN